MSKKQMSMLEAFMTLEDVEDEVVFKHVNEGKSFDVRNTTDMEAAKEFVESDNKKEVALEVIDVDADALDHVKDNKEYVGQMIIQCNSCKATRFIDAEDLVESEADSEIYNVADECPHCHGTGTGFHLLGQVGAVEDAKEDIPVENDSLTDEVKFDNDEEAEPEETPEEPTEEPEKEPEEEPEEEEEPEISEDDGMETSAADDTEDSEGKLGDVLDSEDVAADDTEEESDESLTKEEPEKFVDDELEEVKDEEEKKDESLEESIEISDLPTSQFLNWFIEPENISEVLIYNLDEGDEETEVFRGNYTQLPLGVLKSTVGSFSTGEGKLIFRVNDSDPESEDKATVRDVLAVYTDDFNDNVMVVDNGTDEEIISGTPDSVKEAAGKKVISSIECPERLELRVRNLELKEGLGTEHVDELNFEDPEERLVSEVLDANNLKEHKVHKYGTTEYWINESIKTKEDLDFIYDNFVKPHDNSLIREFKEVTGYKTVLDELLLNEEPRKHNPGKQISEEDAIELAKNTLKDDHNLIAVVYRYVTDGGFHSLPDGNMMPIKTDTELRWATDLVQRDYEPKGSVRVLYRRNIEETFESRKALKDAILECKNNNQPYSVKSLGGSKYTLIREMYEEGDPEFVDMDDMEVEQEVQPEPEASETQAISSQEDEALRRIADVAHNTAEAIAECYGVTVDERAILLDIIRDFQLVSGALEIEDLPEGSLEDATRQLYAERNLRLDFEKAIEMLFSAAFDKEAIKQRIRNPQFLQALRAGQVPGVTFEGNPEDIVLLEEVKEELPEEPKEDEVEFDEKKFDEAMSKYLNKTFVTESGYISDEGNLILEGLLDDSHVTFTINPSDKYLVKSECLTEEVHYDMNESFLWFHAAEQFDTEDQAKEFVEEYLKAEEERAEEPIINFNEEQGKWFVLFCTFDLIDMEKWKNDFGYNKSEENPESPEETPVETPEVPEETNTETEEE